MTAVVRDAQAHRYDAGPTDDGAGPPFTGSFGDRRLVWTGRWPALAPGGRDGWSVMVGELGRLLDHSHETVVLDPLSFPWRSWHSFPRSTTPLVVRMPGGLDADGLAELLEKSLLRRVTAHDRLLVRRADVAAALSERYGLPDACFLVPDDDEAARDDWWHGPLARRLEAAAEPDPAARQAKETFELEIVAVLERLAELPLPFGSTRLRVHALGDPAHTRLLGYRAPEETQVGDGLRIEPGPSPEEWLAVQTPHASVVWLADGSGDAATHARWIADAHARLDAGGHLIVVGWAVDGPHGPNPSISSLCAQIHDATAAMVHLDELRTFRHPAEAMTRGVLLSYTRLGPGPRA